MKPNRYSASAMRIGRIGTSVLLVWLTLVAQMRLSVADESRTVVVSIHVLDEVSKLAIPRAEVRIVSDAREYIGLTDSTGIARFDAPAAAEYGVFATEPDFAFANTYVLNVKNGTDTNITILGSRVRVRRIGKVQAIAGARPDPGTSLTLDSPSTQLAGSVGASLGSMTSVSLGTQSTGLTIHNESSALSTATVNGAPIFPSGSKLASSLFSADIFSGANVGGGVIGAPNGTLNFSTYDPVIDWGGVVQGRIASFGSSSYSLLERGTAGRLGVALVHSQRADAAPFDNKFFLDTSGVGYIHDTMQRSTADTVTLRYGLNFDNTAHFDFGRISTESAEYCSMQTGPSPCGFGPGAVTQRSAVYTQVRDDLGIGRGSLSFNAFVSRTDSKSDLSNELVERQPIGTYSRSVTKRLGEIVSFNYPITDQRSASLSFSSVSESTSNAGKDTAQQPFPAESESRTDLGLRYPLIRSRKFEQSVSYGSNSARGSSAISFGSSARYAVTPRDLVTASFVGGMLASRAFGFNGVDQALGNGPGKGAVPGTTQQLNVGYSRRSQFFQLALNGYHNLARNAPVSAVLRSDALPASLFDAAYFAAASSVAGSECVMPTSLNSSNVFLRTTDPVSRLVNNGADLSASLDLNPRVSLTAAYSLSLQRAYGASDLFSKNSNLSPGELIPGSTVSHANLGARFAASRVTTLILNTNIVGTNNPYQQRAFLTLDAGIRSKFGNNDLVFAMQNITNAAAENFSGFGPFPNLMQSYSPRTFSIRVRVLSGRQNIDKADYLSKPVMVNSSTLSFTPVDYEPRPPKGWLEPSTGSIQCGPELLQKGRQYLDRIAAFAQAVEANRSKTPLDKVAFSGMTLSQITNQPYPAIRIQFANNDRASFRPFLSCSSIHEGNYDQAKALGIYIPSWQERENDGIYVTYYEPQVGIYTSPDPVDATGGTTQAVTLLPNKSPASPFALSPSCPTSLAPSVTESVAKLRTYIEKSYAGLKPLSPDAFAVSKHNARAEQWLEIRADNAAVGEAIVRCLAVPSAKSADIAQRGLSGAYPPSFNYAPSIGFYTTTP